jgi:hypothetical protein
MAHKQKKVSKATVSKVASAKAAAAPDAGLPQERIKVRAYELYLSRGGEHGQDRTTGSTPNRKSLSSNSE